MIKSLTTSGKSWNKLQKRAPYPSQIGRNTINATASIDFLPNEILALLNIKADQQTQNPNLA